jgi:PAS domain S-box-containing protein
MAPYFQNLKLRAKIAILGVGSVIVTAIILVILTIWQINQFNLSAQENVNILINSDIDNIAYGIYNLVQTEDLAVQQQIHDNLRVAQHVLDLHGEISLSDELITWQATNQFTNTRINIKLPKLYIGNQWIEVNTNPTVHTLVVDEVETLVGNTTTIFQRMNENGDMLRVATTIRNDDDLRAIGTYIPANNPDGTPNQVISTILNGNTYLGRAYVVNDWYLTAYKPILDNSQNIIGMLYVGMKLEHLEERVRKAIINTKVGDSGYVFVLLGTGADQGQYIISKEGIRDGENIWNSVDASGEFFIRTLIAKALILEPEHLDTIRYLWQNPGEPNPRWKIARLSYYQPWDWVIGISAYEDELQVYTSVLDDGKNKMTGILGITGILLSILMGISGLLIANSITNPIRRMTKVVEIIAQGDLNQELNIHSKDEIGILAASFNQMTIQLRETVNALISSEESLKKAQQIAIIGNWEINFINDEITWSDEMYRIYEKIPLGTNISGKMIFKLIHPDDRDLVKNTHLYSRNQKAIIEIDYRLQFSNGRTKFLHERSETIFDSAGNAIKKIGTTQDVSAQKFIERKNLELVATLEGTLEATDNGILVVSHDSKIILTNHRFVQMLHIPETIIASHDNKKLLEFIKEQTIDPDKFVRIVKKINQDPNAELFDIVDLKDGRTFERASLPMILDGNVNGRVWSYREITERIKAESELKERQREHETLLMNLPGLAYRCKNDQYFTMEFVSDGCFALTGYEPAELINNKLVPYSDLVFFEDRDRIHNIINLAIKNKESFTLTYRLITRKGEIRWVWEQGTGVFSTKDNQFFLEGYITDITNLKLTEEALEKRIIALTKPLEDSGNVVFEELFNLSEIQKLQDDFAAATGVASIITHIDGSPITKPSHFCRLCQDIIRKTEKGLSNCYKSDAKIGNLNFTGPTIQPCLSGGLWDAGAAISVGGKHIANWLIGQVRDETQTIEKISQYAQEINADEDQVIEAFLEVPSMSKEKFSQVSQALFTLASQLSSIAYQNVQQARFIAENKNTEEILRQNSERIEALLHLNQMTDANLQQVVDYALDKAVFLTHSKVGYLAFLNDDESVLSMVSWSSQSTIGKARSEKPSKLAVRDLGLLGESVRQRKAIIINDYDAPNLSKKGVPSDHVTISRYLSIPVFVGKQIVLVAGVGNKEKVYDENDIQQLTLLLEGMWRLIERIRSEEQLKHYSEHLQDEVDIRTSELQNANQELETFSYSVSHDLRSHLRAMSGFSQIILDESVDKLDNTNKTYLENIILASQQMNSLIDDLLELSHISHAEMQIESVNLSDLAHLIVDDYMKEHPNRDVHISIQEAIIVQGSKGLLKVALENLLTNALKYSSKKSRADIIFGSQQIEEKTIYFIRDNGAGFDMKNAELIFKPFRRLHPTSEFPGTGIGLSIVQRIIERHGGKIWAEAEIGKGAIFYFSI